MFKSELSGKIVYCNENNDLWNWKFSAKMESAKMKKNIKHKKVKMEKYAKYYSSSGFYIKNFFRLSFFFVMNFHRFLLVFLNMLISFFAYAEYSNFRVYLIE